MKFYHVFADGKTVKEIDLETYQKYMRSYPNRKIVAVGYGFINIASYQRTQYISMNQMIQILGEDSS